MTMDGVSYCEVAKMRNQINSLTKENDELKQSKEALVKTVAELTEKLSITESTLKECQGEAQVACSKYYSERDRNTELSTKVRNLEVMLKRKRGESMAFSSMCKNGVTVEELVNTLVNSGAKSVIIEMR